MVTSRMGRVSRNREAMKIGGDECVTSRMGRVSRNIDGDDCMIPEEGHVPHGACE